MVRSMAQDLIAKTTDLKVSKLYDMGLSLFLSRVSQIFRTRIDDEKIIESNDQLARMFGYINREAIINT